MFEVKQRGRQESVTLPPESVLCWFRGLAVLMRHGLEKNLYNKKGEEDEEDLCVACGQEPHYGKV